MSDAPNEYLVGFLTIYPKDAAAKYSLDVEDELVDHIPADRAYILFARLMPEPSVPSVQPQNEEN